MGRRESTEVAAEFARRHRIHPGRPVPSPTNVHLLAIRRQETAPGDVCHRGPPRPTSRGVGRGAKNRSHFAYVQRLARPQKAPLWPSRMKTPGQRRSRRYASPVVGVTGTVTFSGPGPMLCGEPEGRICRDARSYPNSVACGKIWATMGTPTLKVMSDGEVMVREAAPASEAPTAGVEVTEMSFGQSSTSCRWIALPSFGSVPVATSTIWPPQPMLGCGPAGSRRKKLPLRFGSRSSATPFIVTFVSAGALPGKPPPAAPSVTTTKPDTVGSPGAGSWRYRP